MAFVKREGDEKQAVKMNNSDDIDFFYSLDGYGWSTCYIFVGRRIYHMGPTHIFGNPLEELLYAFEKILKGETVVEFKWYDEPGEYRWKITTDKRQQHMMKIEIAGCTELVFDSKSKVKTLIFNVKIKMFCLCVFYQMEKIRGLMSEKSCQKIRGDEFPHAEYKEFRKLLLQKYRFQ